MNKNKKQKDKRKYNYICGGYWTHNMDGSEFDCEWECEHTCDDCIINNGRFRKGVKRVLKNER